MRAAAAARKAGPARKANWLDAARSRAGKRRAAPRSSASQDPGAGAHPFFVLTLNLNLNLNLKLVLNGNLAL